MSVALMLDDAPTSPPAAVQQGPAERVWWCVYDAPPGCPSDFVIIRWRARAGQTRAVAEEVLLRATLELARSAVPQGLVRSVPKKRVGKNDRLRETWSEAT